MNTSNRASLLAKSFKALKKHFKPVAPPADRAVLEHLLYGCCLENSKHEQVDEVIAKLQQNYFDWNEVRVATITELAEVMSVLSDPSESATRLKRTLHAVFETHYSFDLDFLKKQNLGEATKEIEKLAGVTPYTVSYAVQNALSGHSIPVNRSGYEIFVILGIITETDARKKRVPGLERAIPKSKGGEFGSIFQQLSVDFEGSPYSSRIRNLLLNIAPDAKDRLPKRGAAEKGAPEKGKPKSKTRSTTVKRTEQKGVGKKKRIEVKTGPPKKKSATKRLTRKKPR
jgi:endonuclease III